MQTEWQTVQTQIRLLLEAYLSENLGSLRYVTLILDDEMGKVSVNHFYWQGKMTAEQGK